MDVNLDNLRNEYIVIVPVFIEERKVKTVINSLLSTFPILKIYVIDDGSTDKTTEIIKEFKHENLTKLFNDINYGKGYSIRLALSKIIPSKNKIIFTLTKLTSIFNIIPTVYEKTSTVSI